MEDIKITRMGEQIAAQIAAEILSGRIAPGTALKQEELASLLQASRIPVREALQILVEQGLAYRLSSRHVLVSSLKEEHIQQTFSAIAHIVGLALLEAIDRGIIWMDGIALHRLAQSAVSNPYLAQLLNNADLYYLQHLPLSSQEALLQEQAVRRSFGKAQKQALQEAVQGYYEKLAQAFINHRRSQA